MLSFEDAADKGYVELLLDGSHGIYLPQSFVKNFDRWPGISSEDESILHAGPDHEHYWEAWESVLDGAYFIDGDGHEWRLIQDGDLWAYRTDVDIDWDTF